MPCYHPLSGWRSRRVELSGRRKIVFNINEGFRDLPVTVPCGQCIGCRLDRSRSWAVRIMHEAEQELRSCFLTLTYNDDFLPKGETLVKEHVQKFWKRLRKQLSKDEPDVKIKYYQCGEYGEREKRPHYHAVVIGWRPTDLKYYKTQDGNKLYTSDSLTSIWGFGHVIVGQVSFDSAAYVARYITEKITGEPAKNHYGNRIPEFSTCSHGIGKAWANKNFEDVLRAGGNVRLPTGKSSRPARYYDKIWEGGDHEKYLNYKAMQKEKGKLFAFDNTPERLEVKERVKKSIIKKLRRDYNA